MQIPWDKWLRSNAPLIVFLVILGLNILAACYAWGHAMGKRDLLIAASFAGKAAREGSDRG